MAEGKLNVSILLKVIDQATGNLKRVRQSFQGLTSMKQRADKAFASAANISRSADALKNFGSAIFDTLSKPLAVATDFQAAMAAVRGRSSMTGKEFLKVKEFAKEMGDTTRFSSIEAAEGLGFLAIAGFNAEQQMATLPATMDLATAAGVDLARSSDILSDIMGAFAIPATEATGAADTLTRAFTGSNTTLETLFETIKFAGPIMKDFGVSLKDASALAGVLGGAGIKGSRAGTALRTFFSRMAAPRGEAQKVLAFLKINPLDAEKNLRPALEVLQEFRDKTAKMGSGVRGGMLNMLFGTEGATGASILARSLEAGGPMDKMIAKMNESGKTAKLVAELMGAPTKASTELNSAFEGLQRELGEKLKPSLDLIKNDLVDLARGTSEWVKANPELVTTLLQVAGAVAVVATGLGVFLSIVASLVAGGGALMLFLFAVGKIATAITFVISLLPVLAGLLATAATAVWAFAAPWLTMAAPFLAVAVAITAVSLAIGQLIANWERLDASEAFQGIKEFASEHGVLSTVGELLNPSALVSDIKSTVGGFLKIEVEGPAKVIEAASQGVDMDIDTGFAGETP
jgi:TP901 family phage tail tape measure protein